MRFFISSRQKRIGFGIGIRIDFSIDAWRAQMIQSISIGIFKRYFGKVNGARLCREPAALQNFLLGGRFYRGSDG